MATRYGILGFGHHGVKRLVPGFERARQSVLHGLWRRDPAKAAQNAQDFHVPLVFDTPEALCASPEIDAVFVASPDSLHLHDVLLALEHRKPVLCEKPLAMNAGEARQMVEAAERAGVPFGVAHVFRFDSSVQLIRRWVREGAVGRVLLARSDFRYQAQNSPRTWIADPALACGGPVGDVGVHCIDTLRAILDDADVTHVFAEARQDELSGPLEASALLSLRFASGVAGSVYVSARSPYATPLEIVGETGSIRAYDGLTVDRPVRVDLLRNGVVERSAEVSNADAYAAQVDCFSRWLEGVDTFPVPGLEGWKNQRVLDAAYRSWRSGTLEAV